MIWPPKTDSFSREMIRRSIYSILAGPVGDIVAYVAVVVFAFVVVTLLALMPLLPVRLVVGALIQVGYYNRP
jgi:uncharacterized membrane protein